MEKVANNDITILNSAKNNAKKLIEQYIINVGKQPSSRHMHRTTVRKRTV